MTGHIIATGLVPDAVHDWLGELTADFKIRLMAELAIDVSQQTGQSLPEVLQEVTNEVYESDVFDDRLSA